MRYIVRNSVTEVIKKITEVVIEEQCDINSLQKALEFSVGGQVKVLNLDDVIMPPIPDHDLDT